MFSNAYIVPWVFGKKTGETNEEALDPVFGHKLGGIFGDLGQFREDGSVGFGRQCEVPPMQQYTKNEAWSSVMYSCHEHARITHNRLIRNQDMTSFMDVAARPRLRGQMCDAR